MTLYFRFIFLIFKLIFSERKTIQLFESDQYNSMVLPSDLDLIGHMNNSKFLSLMDLARFQLLFRAGAVKLLLQKRYKPVVTHLDINYKKELKLFEKFSIHSSLKSWDEKSFYIKQIFKNNRGDVIVEALFKGVIIRGRKRVAPEDFLKQLFDDEIIPETKSHEEL